MPNEIEDSLTKEGKREQVEEWRQKPLLSNNGI